MVCILGIGAVQAEHLCISGIGNKDTWTTIQLGDVVIQLYKFTQYKYHRFTYLARNHQLEQEARLGGKR